MGNRYRLLPSRNMIISDAWMMSVLQMVQKLRLPDWCICAGFVRSKVWDHIHEFERTQLPDIDVAYFDATHADESVEKEYEKILRNMDPLIPWSVKNQARMHTKNDHVPYVSTAEALANFPEVCTAIGAYLDFNDQVQLVALYGVDDLVNLIVRPTPFFFRKIEDTFMSNESHQKDGTKGGIIYEFYNLEVLPVDFSGGGFCLYVTTDGGVNWHYTRPLLGKSYIQYDILDSRHIFAVMGRTLYESKDLGRSWLVENRNLPAITSLDFVSSRIGYAIGKNLWRTSNGGRTWSMIMQLSARESSGTLKPDNTIRLYITYRQVTADNNQKNIFFIVLSSVFALTEDL